MQAIEKLSFPEKEVFLASLEKLRKNSEFFVIRFYHYFLQTKAGKLFLSIILLEISAKIHSSSIKADAKNYRMDSLTSTGVLIAIIGAYFGFSILDLVVAFLVSLLIFKTAWGITREALAVLLDEAPAGLEKKVIEISKTVPGVINVHEFRARQLGGRRIIADCHIHVAHHISVDEAHKIMHNLEHAIYENTSITEILIHVEPDNQPC